MSQAAAGTTTTGTNRFRAMVAGLFPGYFALVMATGIVATAAMQQNLTSIARLLFWIAAASYVWLWILSLLRLLIARDAVVDDLTSHARGFASLTLVAATNVLAAASGVIEGWWGLTRGLWIASLLLWAIVLYVPLISAIVRKEKPSLGAGINGTWFLLAVATESIAVVGALLIRQTPSDLIAFLSLAAFGVGFVLYLIVMTMLFLRWTFQPTDPSEFAPPAWIAAGAVAITVLAGSNLIGSASFSDRLARVEPFLEGMVAMAWATATFWFPVMVAIGIWRHAVQKVPLRYHPSFWAMVFPLGMYGASTFNMLKVIKLDGLAWLPKVALAIAGIAWAATALGLVIAIGAAFRSDRDEVAN